MNLCTRVTPQSLLEINKIEINDKTLQLPIPSVTGNLRPSDKIRKDFRDLHIEITQITGITLAQDTDLVLNHKETHLNDIIIHIDLHQDLEILDHDLEHPQETDNKTE